MRRHFLVIATAALIGLYACEQAPRLGRAAKVDESVALSSDARRKVATAERAIRAASERIATISDSASFEEVLAVRAQADRRARSALGAADELGPRDQQLFYAAVWPLVSAIDADNTAWLRSRAPENGWFTADQHGETIEKDAFLIVQHSDDMDLMKSALRAMEQDLANGRAAGDHYAMLYDRLALRELRPQRFGTQYACVSGVWSFVNLEKPEEVEARRRDIQMSQSHADYEASIGNIGQACANY